MRLLKALTRAFVLTALFCSALRPAAATTLKAFDLKQLAQRSTLVVRARVGESTAVWRQRVIHTLTRIDVTRSLRGKAPPQLTLVQMGGRLGDDWMPVEGTAELQPGEDVVLFLIQQPDGMFVLAGMSQGKLHVNPDGALTWAPTAPLWDGSAVKEAPPRRLSMKAVLNALGAP